MRDLDKVTGDTRCLEERYREMFNNAPLAVFRSSLDGHILDANPGLAELLGFESPGEVIGYYRDIGTDLYEDPDLREKVIKELTKRGMYTFEGRFKDRQGRARDAEIHLRIVYSEDGEPLYIEGVGADISARKNVELRIIRQAK